MRLDFYTTMLSLAGIPHKKNDGENLMPVLVDNKTLNRDQLFWHFPHYHGSGWKPGSAIRQGDWKLVVHYEDERAELFNLAEDPGETMDISENFPEKLIELKLLLEKKLIDTNGRYPIPNPGYGPD